MSVKRRTGRLDMATHFPVSPGRSILSGLFETVSYLVECVVRWVETNRSVLESFGLTVELTRGPSGRDKGAAWVDLDSPTRLVRLILWDSGEGSLTVGDVGSGDVLVDENLSFSGEHGVEQSLRNAVAWARARDDGTPTSSH
jgi:hypothetical protein